MAIIRGKLIRRSEVGFTSNDKKKRTFWLDCSGFGKNHLEFTLYGDNVKEISRYKMKEEIEVTYFPKGFLSDNRGKEKIMQSLVVSMIENDTEKAIRKGLKK